jgi:hypothetical protein
MSGAHLKAQPSAQGTEEERGRGARRGNAEVRGGK